MNSKKSIVLSAVAIAAVQLLFASGPIVANQHALAVVYYHGHYGHYHGHYGHYHYRYHGHYHYRYHGHHY